MRLRLPVALLLLAGMLLAVPLTLSGTEEVSAKPGEKEAPITETEQVWEIKDAKVMSLGESVEIPEGVMHAGYVIEAKAKAARGALLPKGTFRMEVQAFSPAEDMPGQKAGSWYVKGEWEIVKEGATKAELASKHSASRLSGTLLAELPFNPATDAGPIAAKARLPMSPDGGQWKQGDLYFSGNEKFEGTIGGDLRLWPKDVGGEQ